MGYPKNNNRNFNNGGYRNNNNRNFNNSRPRNNFNDNNFNNNRNYTADTQRKEFALDFAKNAKPDLPIRDARFNVYTIPADFSTDFIVYFTERYEKIMQLDSMKNDKNKKNEVFVELVKMLKEIILKFINLNLEDVEYTEKDVTRGFPSLDMMMDIFYMIANKLNENVENSKLVKTHNN